MGVYVFRVERSVRFVWNAIQPTAHAQPNKNKLANSLNIG